MAHWHDYNPWAHVLVYTPDLESWLDCLAGGLHGYDKEAYRARIEREQPGQKIDCYILPQPSGMHSIGLRFGPNVEDYYSPEADYAKAQAIIDRFGGVSD